MKLSTFAIANATLKLIVYIELGLFIKSITESNHDGHSVLK